MNFLFLKMSNVNVAAILNHISNEYPRKLMRISKFLAHDNDFPAFLLVP